MSASPRLVVVLSCSENRQTPQQNAPVSSITSLPCSFFGDFDVDGCSAEAKILGPTFARNDPGLPNQ